MIEIVALLLAIIIGGISVINKTEVALLKDLVRKKYQISDFSFMSNRALMGYMSRAFLTPLIFLIDINKEHIKVFWEKSLIPQSYHPLNQKMDV